MTPFIVGCLYPRDVPTDAVVRSVASLLGHARRFLGEPGALNLLTSDTTLHRGQVVARGPLQCIVAATAQQLHSHPGLIESFLDSYLVQGPSALAGLDQPWSLILWDQRTYQLLLRRDQMGVVPLYYSDPATAGLDAAHAQLPLVMAASSLAVLSAALPGQSQIADHAIADQLLGTFLPGHATVYQHLHAVPPGHWVMITPDGQARRHRYWRLPPAHDRPADSRLLSRPEEAAISETLLVLLRRAVGNALTDGPVGSWLSAGLDSSTVTALAAAALAAPATAAQPGVASLASVTLRFPGMPGADEGPYLAAFHRHVATTRHETVVDGRDPLAHLPELAQVCGQPFLMGNSIYSSLLAQTSAASGCRTVLTGHDGDSVFGYRTMHLGDLVRHGQIGRALGTWALMAHHHCLPRRRLFTDSVWAPLLQRMRRALGRQQRLPRHPTAAVADLLTRTGAWERAEAQWAGLAERAHSAREEHYRELTSASLAQATTFFAHVGQAHGIAIRHPLLDVRLVEFCHRLPASAMNRHGWTRYALRRAMAGILPAQLRWRRRKANLSQPLYRAVSAHGQGTARTLLQSASLQPYVRSDTIATLLGSLAATPWQQLDDASLPGIWNLLWLAAWLPSR